MEQFGYPPQFPTTEEPKEQEVERDIVPKDKSKGKKVKANWRIFDNFPIDFFTFFYCLL